MPFSKKFSIPLPTDALTFGNFSQASNAVLAYLDHEIPMGAWMVTRVQDNDWIVLQARDHDFNVEPGQTLCWSDSYCMRMIHGKGPQIAPDKDQVPAYVEAPINALHARAINSYVGIPLGSTEGSLFGTLCGISTHKQPPEFVSHKPLLQLLGALLSTIVTRELEAADATREAEQARLESKRDPLTGLFNRRGLEELLASEEQRCQKYGNEACVLSLDLNGLKDVNDAKGHAAGDRLIRSTADALRAATRKTDVIARIGGDEFIVLAVDCNMSAGQELCNRIGAQFSSAGISASIGLSRRMSGQGINGAIEAADALMYEAKRAVKHRSSPRVA